MQKRAATEQVTARDLYDRDYLSWIEQTAADLRVGNFQDLDLENLIEEIEAMGRSEKRAMYSNLVQRQD